MFIFAYVYFELKKRAYRKGYRIGITDPQEIEEKNYEMKIWKIKVILQDELTEKKN